LPQCGQAATALAAARFGTIRRQQHRPGRGSTLASRSELSAFLEGVERRAFKQAVFAVREQEAALDIVQDAMLRLAEKYGDRPASELPLLFHRIMQNAIRDWFRRQKVRSLWTTLLSSLSPGRDDDEDPLETLEAADESKREEAPGEQLERAQVLEIIEREISRLPERQREAFIMRYWEELDVAETARRMRCSEGSVKTHCSRAAHALAAALRARGITL
jgi:RNA polymerase sigma-70 factor (ECF subfamily)